MSPPFPIDRNSNWIFCSSCHCFLQAQSPHLLPRVLSDPADQNTLWVLLKAENYHSKPQSFWFGTATGLRPRLGYTIWKGEKGHTGSDGKNFQKESSDRKNLLAAEQKHISELTNSKDTSERYHGLFRKAAIAFAAWIILVLILMQFRKRKLKVLLPTGCYFDPTAKQWEKSWEWKEDDSMGATKRQEKVKLFLRSVQISQLPWS